MKYVPQQWSDNCFLVVGAVGLLPASRLITTQSQYATLKECQTECDRLNSTVIEWREVVLKVTEGDSDLYRVRVLLPKVVVQQLNKIMIHAKHAISLSRLSFTNMSFELPVEELEAVERDFGGDSFTRVRLSSCYIKFTGDDTFFLSGWTVEEESFSTQLAVLADFKAVA